MYAEERGHVNGDEIREARAALGWTLDDMAEELGVHRMTVHRWETGTHTPPRYLGRVLRDLLREKSQQEERTRRAG